jgi:hypothetical protein
METLEYAPQDARQPHAGFSVLSLAAAVLTIPWLTYVQFVRPKYHQGGPLWQALWEWSVLPGVLGFVLAIAAVLQPGRHRLSVVAIIVIVLAYIMLMPPTNFA